MRMIGEKSFFQAAADIFYERCTMILGIFLFAAIFGVFDAGEALAAASDFYGGDKSTFIDKSVMVIKIVRFIAIFIVIAGIVWAGAEFAIKHDQQRGSVILVTAVIGGFAVLLAPMLINFIIGGLGFSDSDITDVNNP